MTMKTMTEQQILATRKRVKKQMIKEGYTFSLENINENFHDFTNEATVEFKKRMAKYAK